MLVWVFAWIFFYGHGRCMSSVDWNKILSIRHRNSSCLGPWRLLSHKNAWAFCLIFSNYDQNRGKTTAPLMKISATKFYRKETCSHHRKTSCWFTIGKFSEPNYYFRCTCKTTARNYSNKNNAKLNESKPLSISTLHSSIDNQKDSMDGSSERFLICRAIQLLYIRF